MYTCAITGHRPTRFKFKYNENDSRCKRLKRCLKEQFMELYGQGVRRFLVGGALGVDMWSGEILLKLKLEPEYNDIEAECITVGQKAWRESFIQRNRYLVDHADCSLAVYDNERSIRSGTGMTVHYAEKKELPVIMVHPDTTEVYGYKKTI